MTLQLDDLALFVTIADEGSFAAAGRKLGLPKATVSRRLSGLEGSLGVPLFRRSTRALSLTDEGRRRYDVAAPGVQVALEGQAAMQALSSEAVGLVRISATSAIGEHLIVPVLPALLTRYPKLKVELRLTERRVDVIGEGVDLVVRMGLLEDSDLVASPFATVSRLVVGTPSVVRDAAVQTPDDLRRTRCIVQSPELTTWRFASGLAVDVPWQAAVGTMAAAKRAALAGCGLALLPDFMVADDLATGDLVRALPQHDIEVSSASLVASRNALRSAAVRAVWDELRGTQ